MPVASETDKKEEPVVTESQNKKPIEAQQMVSEIENKEEPVVTETQNKKEKEAQPMQNVPQDMVSIKKKVEAILQEGQSVEDSKVRIGTLKEILIFLQKKDGQVSESNNDDIHKNDGIENTKQSVQENISDKTDKTDDAVYKLHVQVDSGNEDNNEVKTVVAEIVDQVILKVDDEEAKNDKDVENVTEDCEVGGEQDKLSDVDIQSIAQMENAVPEPSGPCTGDGVGPGYIKSIDETCTDNLNVAKKGGISCSSEIDVSSGETNTTVMCVQLDADVSDVSEAQLVIDESATAEGVSIEDTDESSSESVICHGGEVPLLDQEWCQSTLPHSQMPRVDPYAKFKERQEKHSSDR